jgi:hypothetical protein
MRKLLRAKPKKAAAKVAVRAKGTTSSRSNGRAATRGNYA